MPQHRKLDLPSLLKAIEPYNYLMHDPVTEGDLEGLYQLYDSWVVTLGDSPEAVALCNALHMLIEVSAAGLPVGEHYSELTFLLQDIERPYSLVTRQVGYLGSLMGPAVRLK